MCKLLFNILILHNCIQILSNYYLGNLRLLQSGIMFYLNATFTKPLIACQIANITCAKVWNPYIYDIVPFYFLGLKCHNA